MTNVERRTNRQGLSWGTWPQACWLILRGQTRRPALPVALVVGTLLTVVNQLDVILSGTLSLQLAVRVAANYAIPYVVSSVGFLNAFRRCRSAPPDGSAPTWPSVTADQMREVDRIMVEDLRIELPQMMENAGRGLAEVAMSQFAPRRVAVLVGPGGNGGGGLVAARHLHNRGVAVIVVLAGPESRLTALPAHQLDILRRMGATVVDATAGGWQEVVSEGTGAADLIVDALVGYSLVGEVDGVMAALVEWANLHRAPILSLDVPTGVDATSGVVGRTHIKAEATATLALPKTGLANLEAVGRLFLIDISVPPGAYAVLGMEVPPLRGEVAEIAPSTDSRTTFCLVGG